MRGDGTRDFAAAVVFAFSCALASHFLTFTPRTLLEMSAKRKVPTLKGKLRVVEMQGKRYSYARIATEFQKLC